MHQCVGRHFSDDRSLNSVQISHLRIAAAQGLGMAEFSRLDRWRSQKHLKAEGYYGARGSQWESMHIEGML